MQYSQPRANTCIHQTPDTRAGAVRCSRSPVRAGAARPAPPPARPPPSAGRWSRPPRRRPRSPAPAAAPAPRSRQLRFTAPALTPCAQALCSCMPSDCGALSNATGTLPPPRAEPRARACVLRGRGCAESAAALLAAAPFASTPDAGRSAARSPHGGGAAHGGEGRGCCGAPGAGGASSCSAWRSGARSASNGSSANASVGGSGEGASAASAPEPSGAPGVAGAGATCAAAASSNTSWKPHACAPSAAGATPVRTSDSQHSRARRVQGALARCATQTPSPKQGAYQYSSRGRAPGAQLQGALTGYSWYSRDGDT